MWGTIAVVVLVVILIIVIISGGINKIIDNQKNVGNYTKNLCEANGDGKCVTKAQAANGCPGGGTRLPTTCPNATNDKGEPLIEQVCCLVVT